MDQLNEAKTIVYVGPFCLTYSNSPPATPINILANTNILMTPNYSRNKPASGGIYFNLLLNLADIYFHQMGGLLLEGEADGASNCLSWVPFWSQLLLNFI